MMANPEPSQGNLEGATTIPEAGVGSSDPKRPAPVEILGDDMVCSAWQHAAVPRNALGSRAPRGTQGTTTVQVTIFYANDNEHVLALVA